MLKPEQTVQNFFIKKPLSNNICRSGGTGRRTGLKILRDLYSRTGSIPVCGSSKKELPVYGVFLFFKNKNLSWNDIFFSVSYSMKDFFIISKHKQRLLKERESEFLICFNAPRKLTLLSGICPLFGSSIDTIRNNVFSIKWNNFSSITDPD